MKYFVVVLAETVLQSVFLLPRFRLFNFLKSSVLRLLGAKVGRRVVYYSGIWIFTGRNLTLGDDVDLARGVLITTDGGVEIGDRSLIGYGTSILSSNHVIPDGHSRIFSSGHVRAPVRIGRDVWIGANCTVLPGVEIGEGAVVAAGAVITKDIEPFTIVAGVPAKCIKVRK